MTQGRRLLITGASGQLGAYLLREAVARNLGVVAWSGSQSGASSGIPLIPVDLADVPKVHALFASARPDIVVHAAAVANVAACHRDPQRARDVNVAGTEVLAELAARSRARLVLVSTDLVFDGDKGRYREEDFAKPLSVYGSTKLAAERAVLEHAGNIVVRLSLLFGPALGGQPNFFDQQVAALREGKPIRLFADEWRTPLGMMTAAQALLAISLSPHSGILHVGGPERLSRVEMGQRLAQHLGCEASSIIAAGRNSEPSHEPRPGDTSLDSSLWRSLFPSSPWASLEDSFSELGLCK